MLALAFPGGRSRPTPCRIPEQIGIAGRPPRLPMSPGRARSTRHARAAARRKGTRLSFTSNTGVSRMTRPRSDRLRGMCDFTRRIALKLVRLPLLPTGGAPRGVPGRGVPTPSTRERTLGVPRRSSAPPPLLLHGLGHRGLRPALGSLVGHESTRDRRAVSLRHHPPPLSSSGSSGVSRPSRRRSIARTIRRCHAPR